MPGGDGAADAARRASAAGEDAVQAAVERFVDAHSRGESQDLAAFAGQFPDALRPRILAQCREFLAFDGLLGRQPVEPGAPAESAGRAFGDFDIQEELGRGGMGVVYLARQRSLNRRVALKVMASGLTLSKRHVERFRREAAAAAQLAHPAIVAVHSLVEVDGTFAIAMDFVAGRNLGDILDDLRLANGPEPAAVEGSLGVAPEKGYVAECAMLCAQLASALESAHRQGVVHRDLKPRNLMIDDRRQARLLDFGLSKSLDDGSISLSGEITGTVHYMSPEQTLAKRVAIDHRTDVFALGVILYEMLTLRRPFDGRNMQQVVYEICFKEPVPPQRLNPKVPRDLVTICLKALEKDPQSRYPSAGELEADLLRFLRWEPVHARPAGPFVRLSKWLHRRRTEAIAGAAVLAVALGVAGYAWYSAVLDDREADRLLDVAERHDAAGEHKLAFDSATLALGRRDDDEVRTRIELYRQKIEKAAKQEEVDIAQSALLGLESNQAIARDRELAILLALEAVARRASAESRSAVLAALGSGFRKVSLAGHGGRVLCARWSPDGGGVVTTGLEPDGTATAVLWAADGTRRHTLRGHAGWIFEAAFEPSGARVATASADRSVRLWDVATGALAGSWAHDVAVQGVRFDAAGARALTFGHGSGTGPFVATVWDVAAGRRLAGCAAHAQYITDAALSPCGRFAATAGDQGFVRLWAADSGAELARLEGHRERVAALAFAPDSALVATASMDGRVRVFGVPDGRLRAEAGHSRQVNALAFDGDGGRLVSGSDDMTARLWRLARGDGALRLVEEHQFVGHQGGVTGVGFDRGGQLVATAGRDGVLRVFDAGSGRSSAGVELMRYEAGAAPPGGVAFDAEGQRVLSWNHERALIWDFTDTRGVVTLRQPGKVPAAAFDERGERVVTAGDDERLRLWDAHAGRQLWAVRLGNPVLAVDVAGELVAASTVGGRVHVRRLRDGEELFTLSGHGDDVPVVRFAVAGSRLLTAGDDGRAIVWNTVDRSEVMRLERGAPIAAADLSADGAVLATVDAGADVARLWSVPDGAPRGELGGHDGAIVQVAFRPGGAATLATAGDDGDVRVAALDGQELLRVRTGNPVRCFAWSRDSTRMLTSSRGDGNKTRLFRVGAAVAEELRFAGHTNSVECIAFSPDGAWAVSASRDGTACVWPTDPVGVARRLPLRPLSAAERQLHRLDAAPSSPTKPN